MIEKIFTYISLTRVAWALILTMIVLHTRANSPMHTTIITALFALIVYFIGWHIAAIHSRWQETQLFRTQPNIDNRKYLEQRIETLMKNRRVYRVTSPDCNRRFSITKDTDDLKNVTYRIAFTEEEFLRAGDTNGNINTRIEVFYMITPAHRYIIKGTSTSQVYANNDTEGTTVVRHTCPDHLAYDDFVQIEAALTWT